MNDTSTPIVAPSSPFPIEASVMSISSMEIASNSTELAETMPKFELWQALLVSLGVVVVVNAVFIAILLLYKYNSRRKDVRYIYQTKPIKRWNGTHGSVFSIRSQGILELNSPTPGNHHDYVNVFDDAMATSTPGAEQAQEAPPTPLAEVVETTVVETEVVDEEDGYQHINNSNPDVFDRSSNPDVVYEEVESNSEELGNFNRQSVTRQSIRSDCGRNVHFARQSNTRVSVRSEAGLLSRSEDQGEHRRKGSERDRRSRLQRSHNMSTRSESGNANSQGQRGRNVFRRESTEPIFNFQIMTSSEGLDNSEPRMQPLSIHQISSTARKPRSRSSEYPISDIPGFKDPEILGEGDSLEQLKINLPPDIYSSQILSTVRSPEETSAEVRYLNAEGDDMDGDLDEPCTETRGIVITQRKLSKPSSDNLISLEPDKTRPCLGQPETWDEVSAGEALYDQPILKPLVSIEGSHFHEPLFDDPGYNKGLGLAGQITLSSGDTEHTYNILEETRRQCEGEEREGEDMRRLHEEDIRRQREGEERGGEDWRRRKERGGEDMRGEDDEEREREGISSYKNISEQTAATMTYSAQSLEVLRLLDEELKLDEAISSLLTQEDV